MLKQEQTVIRQSDTAVSINRVTKHFEQWQRSGQGKNILKNLFKPEKKIISALENISFSVKKGEFLAYAGPNGAGKSTTMKLLCGMLLPTVGELEVLGLSPKKDRIALMKRVGVLFGNRTELWWDHPIISSFEWKRVVWDIPKDQFVKQRDKVVEMLDIGGILHTFARELSLGQRMRADVAMMLLHQPELILLDEPTLGLDVLAKRRMIGFLKELNRERGTTVIVTSHDMDDLEEMARRILLITHGRIAFDGSFDSLRKTVGGLCRVTITMKNGTVPQLTCGNLISADRGIYEFEVDTTKMPVKAVLAEISAAEGVEDIEFKKAPIEQVIAELYTSWKEQGE
jgi:ABC-2 type transport system ATP-binding protein